MKKQRRTEILYCRISDKVKFLIKNKKPKDLSEAAFVQQILESYFYDSDKKRVSKRTDKAKCDPV